MPPESMSDNWFQYRRHGCVGLPVDSDGSRHWLADSCAKGDDAAYQLFQWVSCSAGRRFAGRKSVPRV